MNDILFKTNGLVFNNIITYPDCEIPNDKVTFVIGESGIGKSTLLKLFNQTLTQSSGEIYYKDNNIDFYDTINLRKEVLLISQGAFLFDESIKDNFIRFYNFRGETIISDDDMKYYLELCCIPFDLNKDCTTLSGGERQRIYTAIFLSFKPNVLMLDEPTSALDSDNSINVMNNVISFCKSNDITVIIVSHDKDLVMKYAENVIAIEKKDN